MTHHRVLVVLLFFILCLQNVNGWRNPEMVEFAYKLNLVDAFEWQLLEPKVLKLTYDADKLSGKSTFNLYGYSERNATKISKIEMPFTLLSSAAVPDTANGELDVMQLGLKCRINDAECNKYDMGYMQIISGKNETREKSQPETLSSPIVPLGWFLHPSYVKENFPSWPFGKCRTWFTSEPEELKTVMKNVSCPYSMAVAESDPGWYLKSSYLVGFPAMERVYGNSTAEPAQTCFYSSIEDVPPNMYSAPASICCYRNTDSTLLQKEFETLDNPLLHGSSVLRSHPFGTDYHHEHYLPGQVPYLSHWYWDKLPQLYCCHWWKGNACVDFYMKLRPAPQIRRPPGGSRAAFTYGSSVHPIGGPGGDGVLCTEMGEYWLLRTAAIEVQIRNYVVSAYVGPMPPREHHNSLFRVAGSRSSFITAIAMRSMAAPHQVLELVCPEGEFRSYVQATNRETWQTTTFEGLMGRGLGTKVLVGDTLLGQNKRYSFLVKNGFSRVGMYAYVVMPGEDLMNLYISITEDLLASATGLAVGNGACSDSKIENPSDRLFSSLCDNCEDFDKYRIGRPLYYEDTLKDLEKIPTMPHTQCHGDKMCKYMVWSTNYQPFFDESKLALTAYIQPLLPKVGYTGWDVCQNPNISGLFISETQSLNVSATLELKCREPTKPSSEGVTATCKQSGELLEFDVPKDFVCAHSKVVEVEETKAAAADAEYTKKHYTPEAQAGAFRIGPTLATVLPAVACGALLVRWLMPSAL